MNMPANCRPDKAAGQCKFTCCQSVALGGGDSRCTRHIRGAARTAVAGPAAPSQRLAVA